MSSPTTRALLEDAFYQVLDNKIFRLLLILVLALVAPAYLIEFGKDEVTLLYGWSSIPYADVLRFLRVPPGSIPSIDFQTKVIQTYQSLLVDTIVGNMGMAVCVSATAFFVPHMLEKGSADILFSKPVSRRTLLLSRYFAGLLFVGILSVFLIVGIYFGLVVVSGYNDPGFLWGVFTLIYLFGILHAFSTAVGVFTRSTVAAILLTLVLFMTSGCVHGIWHVREWDDDVGLSRVVTTQPQDDARDSESTADASGDSKPWIIRFLSGALDVLHYTLPKTKDADTLAQMLRKAVAGPPDAVVDPSSRFTVFQAPAEFELVAPADPKQSESGRVVDLAHEPAVWAAKSPDGAELVRVEIVRKSRLQERTSGSGKPRKLSTNAAADNFAQRITESGRAITPPTIVRPNDVGNDAAGYPATIGGAYPVFVDWTEPERTCRAAIFTSGDSYFELVATMSSERLSQPERDEKLDTFLDSIQLARAGEFQDRNEWYEKRFGWTSELKFNAFFSIGSSLAFTILMLWLARKRLERIDF
jgi:ABC-type transport system involved in multi-copper enzyme maturation permease subunit